MSKKRYISANECAASKHRYQSVIAITIALCVVGTIVLAQVNRPGKVTKGSSEVSVMTLSASSPSKEYIYAGRKLVATEEPISFADVFPSTPFYNDILKIGRRKVTLGCGVNGQGPIFCPNDSTTREQMSAFIDRALGYFNPPTPAFQRFTDVPPSNQFYNFIDKLAVLQITLGCDPVGPRFCPADTVPHEQMAAFIVRGLGDFNPPTPPTQRFFDVPPSNQFYNFIDKMAALNIWPGCGTDGQGHLIYCPQSPVTRAQMAHILVQAFGANWQ